MKVLIKESQFKVLIEQMPGLTSTFDWQKPKGTINKNQELTKGLVSILQKSRNYHEIHNDDLVDFSNALLSWVKKNPSFNFNLLKASIGILFAESKLDAGELMSAKEVGGGILNLFGSDKSQGFAQVKPSVAKQYGVDIKKVHNMEGALDAVYKIITKNYDTAKQFYKGPNISIFENDVIKEIPATNNDAALHAAIVAHNTGINKIIGNWCETNIKSIANKCNEKSRVVYTGKPAAVTNPNKKITNYIPAIKHSRNYGMNVKNYFDKLSGLPEELVKVSSKNVA